MKKILTLIFFTCAMFQAMAQTDGITYQAVIIGPDDLELPGVDSEGNYLPNTTIAIRFTIYDSGNQVEFQEVQITETDDFGRINLLIGEADHDYFKEISWDGTPKDLKVEIDFEAGSNFEEMSRERLTFLPYAYHRNITATGTLTVDGRTYLNDELQVEGPTNLNSSLDVNNGNATNLTGTLDVDGETNLNNAFTVNNASPTTLTGDLTVNGDTNFDGTLDVIGVTTLNDLVVNGLASFGDLTAEFLQVTDSTSLAGGLNITSDSQIKITSTLQGSDMDIRNYPLLVDGGNQGIAIKVNTVGAQNQNNFISFWDNTPPSTTLREPAYDGFGLTDGIIDLFGAIGINVFEIPTTDDTPEGNTTSYATVAEYAGAPMMWGRIEGETDASEFGNNADYNMDRMSYTYDFVDGSLDLAWQTIDLIKAGNDVLAAATEVQPCFGLGGCVAGPAPSNIYASLANLALEILKEITAIANEAFAVRNLEVFHYHKRRFKGVSYASGAGDYAEYLLRINPEEKMSYGDIVGLYGGKISKNTKGAQRIMVISYKPAVLGALPQPNEEKNYEKVAFMGQVLVKVFGIVNVGDYIVPSGNNDGLGVAISPENLTSEDIKNIVGIAWDSSESQYGFKLINVAVGINNNDNTVVIERLEKQVSEQAKELNELKMLLTETINRLNNLENGNSKTDATIVSAEDNHNDNLETSFTGDIVYYKVTDEDIEKALQMVEDKLIEDGVDIKKHIFNKVKTDPLFKQKLIQKMKERVDKAFHYHKKLDEQSGH